MVMVDRTMEWESAVELWGRLSKKNTTLTTPSPSAMAPLAAMDTAAFPAGALAGLHPTLQKSAKPAKSRLFAVSKALAQEIHALRSQVDRLARLSSVKGLFQDPTPEINAIIQTTREDMQRIDVAMRGFLAEVGKERSALHQYSTSAFHIAQTIARELGIVEESAMSSSATGIDALAKVLLVLRSPGRRVSGSIWNPNLSWKTMLSREVGALLRDKTSRAHKELVAYAAMNIPGDLRQQWSIVADILKAQVLAANKQLQESLRIRSENLKTQATQRRNLARSTWAPVVAGGGTLIDTPLFRNSPVINGHGTSAALPPSQPQPQPQAYTTPTGPPQTVVAPASAAPAAFNFGANILKHRRPHNATQQTSTSTSTNNAYTSSQYSSLPSVDSGDSGSYSYTAQQIARYKDASSRAAEARQVESTIVELGQMFNKMASMVAEQGEVVERIDADMTASLANVQAGYAELNKFYNSVMANRGFILKLFGVLLFVIALFWLVRR